jgi:hypothetical protein
MHSCDESYPHRARRKKINFATSYINSIATNFDSGDAGGGRGARDAMRNLVVSHHGTLRILAKAIAIQTFDARARGDGVTQVSYHDHTAGESAFAS